MKKKKRSRGKLKAGILGCGTIGSYLAGVVKKEFPGQAVISGLCDHRGDHVRKLARKLGIRAPLVPLEELLQTSEIIIEAASPAAVEGLLRQAVRLKRFPVLIIMSTGGLLQVPDLLASYLGAGGAVYVPSGAVAGVDGLLAARESGIKSVLLKTSKPPAGLKEAPYFTKHPFPSFGKGEEKCVFRGTAAEAVRGFPQNINVSAVLSLAGIGPRRTRVEIWCSDLYRFNTHEVLIEYKGGKIRIQAENQPSKENPKTSALAMYSAVALLRKILAPLRVGS